MLVLFKDGKFYGYGSKPDVSFYVKIGYTVKVFKEHEAKEFKAKMKIKNIWNKLPVILKERVDFTIRNDKLSWQDKLNTITTVLDTIHRRAEQISIVHRKIEKEWTIKEQLVGVFNDVFGLVRQLFVGINAANYQLLHS